MRELDIEPWQASGEFTEALHDDVTVVSEEIGQDIGGFAVDRDAEGAYAALSAFMEGAPCVLDAVATVVVIDVVRFAVSEYQQQFLSRGGGGEPVGGVTDGCSQAGVVARA